MARPKSKSHTKPAGDRHKKTAKRLDQVMAAGRKFQDSAASIDKDLDEAIAEIDWSRREAAEKSFSAWVATYGVGTLLDTPPPPRGNDVLAQMEKSLRMRKPLQLQLHRGAGKSAYAQLFILYTICTGRRKFPVIMSANQRAANQLMADIVHVICNPETAIAQDYPTICLPFILANGSFRRRQTYRGKPTMISCTSSDLTLAALDITGQPGNCYISARGITGGVRGLRKDTQRPDLVLLDDLLGEDDITDEATEKILRIINKGVFNLAGKGKMAVVMTSTPLAPDDLTQKLAANSEWVTVKFPAVISWPARGVDDSPVWAKYWSMYDAEQLANKDHRESDEFYRQHLDELELGADLYNPGNYDPTENVSAMQAAAQKRHLIGGDAFDCEYQLRPRRFTAAIELRPDQVLAARADTPQLAIPDGYTLVMASSDLNVSHCITTVIVAFKADLSARVIWHDVHKCKIPTSSISETDYARRVDEVLGQIGQRLRGLGVRINGWAIDAGGTAFNAVTNFCGHSVRTCGIPAAAMLGKASHIWSAYVRSKLRTASGRTILCGDEAEHARAGGGRKWINWDSDYYRCQVQRNIIAGHAIGGLTIYDGTDAEHAVYAQQVSAERLVGISHKGDGRDIYTWRTKSATDHDYLDCTAQAYAAAAQQNLVAEDVRPAASAAGGKTATARRNAARAGNYRRRIKFL